MNRPKKTPLVRGWGIVGPGGYLWVDIFSYRSDAQRDAVNAFDEPWKRLYRQGYRCVRVKLEVVDG